MARLPRLCVPGWPHLLIQLGHNHQPVFRDDSDHQLFLKLLKEAASTHGMAIHAYALQESEIRLLATPETAESLSRAMQAIGRRYGSSFNRRHGHHGSVWEGRFRAAPIEPEHHLLEAMRFVEQASSGGHEDTSMGHAAWSSAAHHLGHTVDPLVSDHLQYWALGNTPFERELAYRRLWQQTLAPEEKARIENAAKKGWPLGSVEFLKQLAQSTGRRLTPLPRGRPPTQNI